MTERDAVDLVLEQWAEARPEINAAPMGIVGRLSRATAILDRRLNAHFAEHGLARGEFDILATLRRAGGTDGLSSGELLTHTMVTSGAITNRVDRLVAKKLVTRTERPGNRRSNVIALTPQGRRLIDEILAGHVANEEALLTGLTLTEQQRLATLLRRLLIGLEDLPPE
ncbi:MarR family winged helix-turn-helix transcriptional regulator [Propionibacteriaceae bacterium Y1700]|uniref:MarR family winged helix-turn-helix transcriptional regulator n=1 Tax=Microlunatus sp. Y1700 TaxID=3418487 RepID=UPI003DA7429F